MVTKYGRELTMLLEQIDRFRRRDTSLDALKSSIWDLARVVSSHDERPLREALQLAENQLDMIEYTVEEPGARAEVLGIVDSIEALAIGVMSRP